MEQARDRGLIRAIRRWDLVALAINGIIGAGIFGLPSEIFRRIGVYSLLAFLVCALAVLLIVLCFGEVGSRFSGTGGPYLYAREVFGPATGFEVGWMLWIARLTSFAANCNLLVVYLAFFMPWADTAPGRATVICVVVGALAAINIIGVRDAARVSNALSIAKLAPLLVFVAVGAFFIEPTAYAVGPWPAYGDFSASVLLMVYAFTGFEVASITGGEACDPRRDLPRALPVALGVVAVFYLAIQFVAIGTLPGLGNAARPLTDAASRFLGSSGAAVITAGVLVSILGNLIVTMLVAPRLLFAMAERRELPLRLTRTHPRFHTPHVAILITAAVVLAVTLSGTFVYAATVSVLARLFAYAVTCAALPVMRRRQDAPAALFVAPAGMAVWVTALAIIAWLVSNSTAAQARDTAIAAAIGLLIYSARSWGRASAVP